MNFTNKTFSEETVNLDNNSFLGCKFIRCVLIYDGTGTTTVADCTFDAPKFTFRGAAQNTLNFMTAIYHAGGRELIEATFDNIRRGATPILPKDDPRQN